MNTLMRTLLKLSGFKLTKGGKWEITIETGEKFIAYVADCEDVEKVMVSPLYSDSELFDESEAVEFSTFIMMMED